MTDSHASSSRSPWRIAALFVGPRPDGVGDVPASGTPLLDFTPFSTASLPAYQRAALFVYYNNPHTAVVPIAVPLVTWGLFRRSSGRPFRWPLRVGLGTAAVAAGVGLASGLVVSGMSPFADDAGVTYRIRAIEAVGPPAILGLAAMCLVALPVAFGWVLVGAAAVLGRARGGPPGAASTA